MKRLSKKCHEKSAKSWHVPNILTWAILLCITSCQNNPPETPLFLSEDEKREAKNALFGMEVHADLEATLFASEPMFINPTNIDVDAKGRVWVCEAYNYRNALNTNNPQKEEGDRIVILEDTNGDGKADTSKVFYQGRDIDAALGIAVMGNKVIVSCSPHVFVFTDEDGDDKPDSKEKLFTDIGGEQNDHGVHAFIFGPDGRLYFNMGNAGQHVSDAHGTLITDVHGRKVSTKQSELMEGMILRCEEDGSNVEVIAHNFRNNYEVTVDSYGNIWQSDNDDDGNRSVRINFVMPHGNYGYKDEMTRAGWRTRRTGMHEEIPFRHWHQNDPGVVPNLLHTGAGSPTGILFYEGDLLPKAFQNQMIHTDAGPNVLRAYPTKKNGAGYAADILNLMKSGEDPWFRPSDVCVAPDGSLIVADWYDPGVGGHQVGDLQKGRIFRITPKDHKGYNMPSFDISSPEGAAQGLMSPNMARRYLAWHQLESMGAKAEKALVKWWEEGKPHQRARALWLLAKTADNPDKYLDAAVKDNEEDIRVAALHVAQRFAPELLAKYYAQLSSDTSAHVRREILIGLRYFESPSAAEIWTNLALQYNGKDRWYLEALGIAADPRADAFFNSWLQKVGDTWKYPENQDIVWRMRGKDAINLMADLISHPAMQQAYMKRYFRAFDFHKSSGKDEVLAKLASVSHPEEGAIKKLALTHISPEKVKSTPSLQQVLRETLATIEGSTKWLDWVKKYALRDQQAKLQAFMLENPNNEMGVEATRILHDLEGLSYFQGLLNSGNDKVVTTTLQAMTHIGTDTSWDLMKKVAMDENRDIAIRRSAVKAMGNGWNAETKLLALLEADQIPEALKAVAITSLMGAIKSSVRETATEMMQLPDEGLPPIKELVALKGSVAKGASIFQTHCSSCHVVNGHGIQFGPELSEIGAKLSKDGLYAAIIQPDAGISFGYEGFIIKLNDGSTQVGYLSSQTETDITLIQMGGISSTIALSDVASMKQMGNSLMPSGLHRVMSKVDLVNLVSYLSSLKTASLASN